MMRTNAIAAVMFVLLLAGQAGAARRSVTPRTGRPVPFRQVVDDDLWQGSGGLVKNTAGNYGTWVVPLPVQTFGPTVRIWASFGTLLDGTAEQIDSFATVCALPPSGVHQCNAPVSKTAFGLHDLGTLAVAPGSAVLVEFDLAGSSTVFGDVTSSGVIGVVQWDTVPGTFPAISFPSSTSAAAGYPATQSAWASSDWQYADGAVTIDTPGAVLWHVPILVDQTNKDFRVWANFGITNPASKAVTKCRARSRDNLGATFASGPFVSQNLTPMKKDLGKLTVPADGSLTVECTVDGDGPTGQLGTFQALVQ